MTSETKYLLFKGIAKKEQIVFKSFLNLAKNELPYQIMIEKDADAFDLVIVDETYEWPDEEKSLKHLPALIIGDDMSNEQANYLSRPVQWSDFKSALCGISFSEAAQEEPVVELQPFEPEQSEKVELQEIDQAAVMDVPDDLVVGNEIVDSEAEEVASQKKQNIDESQDLLPVLELVMEDDNANAVSIEQVSTEYSSGGNGYEFELENMSIDYKSVTNSHYEQVAGDVKEFNQSVGDDEEQQAVILVADEESSFNASVLVLETSFTDEWDVPSEIDVASEDTISVDSENDIKEKKGIEINANEKFWLEDNEVIVDNKSVFYIKTQRDMIYSPKEPGQWTSIFQSGVFSKLPMKNEWRPFKGLKAYPTVYLLWGHTYAKEREVLHKGLNENEAYLLEQWPKFELLELDNSLLKLCSLLFVKPETLSSLARKSRCDKEQVIGFLNACQALGLLTSADQIQIFQPPSSDEEETVFGKIKDVFK